MPYSIVLSKSASKELAAIPNKAHDQIVAHLQQLVENPRVFGSEKLTAINAYKLRVGNYRIVYEIFESEKQVRVVMVEDRKQVYKRLRRKR